MADTEQSEFNEAVNKLQRMGFYFHNCAVARLEKNADLWVQNLASLFQELINSMTNQKIDQEEELTQCVDKVHSFLDTNKSIRMSIPRDIYWKLFKLELTLRKVYKKAGYEGKSMQYAGAALR